MKCRILITGGMGFIGGRLAQHLYQAGNQILLGSRTAQLPPVWLPEAEVVKMAWNDNDALYKTCSRVDQIIHAAGMNAYDCIENPIKALAFNGLTTARLLNAGIRAGVNRFIYLSTAHVYGSPLAGNITEETCPVSLHPYATSHRAGEDMVRAAHQRREIEGVVIRLSNAFGAPSYVDANCWMLLVNDLCRQAVISRSLVLRSSGLERRDFIPLTDLCCAVKHLLRNPLRGLGNGLFNVGGEWSPTIIEMAYFVQQRCSLVLGFQPEISHAQTLSEVEGSELKYCINSLRKTGFQLSMSPAIEIDQLLKFCKASFVEKLPKSC